MPPPTFQLVPLTTFALAMALVVSLSRWCKLIISRLIFLFWVIQYVFITTKQHQYEYTNLLKEQLNCTAEIKRKQNFIHNCLLFPPLKLKLCQTVWESLTNYINLWIFRGKVFADCESGISRPWSLPKTLCLWLFINYDNLRQHKR